MSETFIVAQLASMQRWTPTTLGFHTLEETLLSADCTPYANTIGAKTLRRVFGVGAKRATYLDHLHRTGAALLHAHFGSGGIHSLPLAQATGVPHITTFHGADTHIFGSRLPGAEHWYRRRLEYLFKHSNQLITASSYLADRLVDAGARAQKIEVIYTGTKVVPKIHCAEPLGIAFLGRLIEIKGASHLLKAVAAMKTTHARAIPITIAGDGPMRADLSNLAQSLSLNCNFIGRLPSSDVPEFLARHQIFCAPSIASAQGTREGFGMVFLEAALQELPVIAYASGGVAEAVSHGETGFLASEGNIDELSRYLEHLINNPKVAMDMGRNGRLRVMSKFQLEKQTTILESVYDGLVA